MANTTDKALQKKAGEKAFSDSYGNPSGGDGDVQQAEQAESYAVKAEASKQEKQDKARKAALKKVGAADPADELRTKKNALIKRAQKNPETLSDDEVDEVVGYIRKGLN